LKKFFEELKVELSRIVNKLFNAKASSVNLRFAKSASSQQFFSHFALLVPRQCTVGDGM